MNNDRRKEIRRALALIDQGRAILEQCAEDEREFYDNMPESIQSGEKGNRAEEVASAIESAVEIDLEDAPS